MNDTLLLDASARAAATPAKAGLYQRLVWAALENMTAGSLRLELPDGAIAIPLPHPSGASSWINVPANRVRIAEAVALIHAELGQLHPAA